MGPRLVRLPVVLSLVITGMLILPAGSFGMDPESLNLEAVLMVDEVGNDPTLVPAADLLSVQLMRDRESRIPVLRFSFLSLDESVPGRLAESFVKAGRPDHVQVDIEMDSIAGLRRINVGLERRNGTFANLASSKSGADHFWTDPSDPDAVYLTLNEDPVSADVPWRFVITAGADDGPVDRIEGVYPVAKAYEAHCAFVLHGNQGIGYTDVLHGRGDDLAGSGFDEAMEAHENNNIPGNFHMSGTLMTTAEWAANNGDPVDFNAWLTTGVTAGWAGMITSAYGQHMMPFVNNAMNDWSVEIQTQMVNTRYGYFPTVAWVPERVWLNTSGYPSAGVNDWIGDNWMNHGVNGVILDDDVHLTSHDNHRIHTLSGNGLRLIPRDRDFTGNIIGGNGQAALDILTGLAAGGLGEYRIAVFAEDWEAVAEMGGWAGTTPFAKETYDWMIAKCATESAWLHTWKLADALANPNFNGDTMLITPGTYHEIGGFDGYGGGDNGWYTHWAGFIPYANGGDGSGNCAVGSGNCKNYGTLWNDAYNALLAAPDNNLSQAGWYVMMTNLHETAWHDGMGSPISGWQHKYSAHIKNAMVYAEAAHWANGEYATTTSAYFQDIDNDGYPEAVMHNDHLFAVFEGSGGRMTHLFVRGAGYDDTAIGVDNAYWAGTDGDFNDVNHVAAFSDVSPNYQDTGFLTALDLNGTTVSVVMTHNEVTKRVSMTEGASQLDVVYEVGPATHWQQAGFSPSLVDLVWNAELERVWAPDGSYMGFRNPNTGVAAAYVLGAGGASHQKEISGTLMKGDELYGSGVFQFQIFAGPTSAPDGLGEIAELRTLADNLVDTIGPDVAAARYYPSTGRLQVTFDQAADLLDASGFQIQGQFGQVDLPIATTISETQPTLVMTFALDPATATAVEAMIPDGDIYLNVAAGVVQDINGVANEEVVGLIDATIEVVDAVIAIDGNVDPLEWEDAQVLDDADDSAWTSANEIDRLLVQWDADYLYVAIDGQVSNNSWLLYLDVDPGTANGQTDLTATDAWERGASFTAPGFAADFQYGCYQHQSVFDGDGFWELLSATTTLDRSGEILSAYDSSHLFGTTSGCEMAIPWSVLYGQGKSVVPAFASVSVVASVCWDPEPDGELGGDSAPSNGGAALPVLDTVWTLTVDADGDGNPDVDDISAVPIPAATGMRLTANVPNPFNPSTTLHFEIPGTGTVPVRLDIFDLRGRLVRHLLDGSLPAGHGSVVWDGRNDRGRTVAAGTYYSQIRCQGQVATRPLSLVK